jgi:hypothetical protein
MLFISQMIGLSIRIRHTHNLSRVRFALQSQYFCSHCSCRYASRGPTASGLYRSRPLIMVVIELGRSEGSSPFMVTVRWLGEG